MGSAMADGCGRVVRRGGGSVRLVRCEPQAGASGASVLPSPGSACCRQRCQSPQSCWIATGAWSGRRFTWRSRVRRRGSCRGGGPGICSRRAAPWAECAAAADVKACRSCSGLVCREMQVHAVGPAGGIGGGGSGGGGQPQGRRVRAITGALPSACLYKGSPMAGPGAGRLHRLRARGGALFGPVRRGRAWVARSGAPECAIAALARRTF